MLLILGLAGAAYTQTLQLSGEMKTGLYWGRTDATGNPPEITVKMYNNDDAGNLEGRFRMNLQLTHGIMGMKVRFEQTTWTSMQANQWAFAFAWANLIDNQLKVTVGKLGESPWSAGGPDIWQELDNQVGIRTEVMPHIVPGLDIGFVLNGWNNSNYFPGKNTLSDMLMETVMGVAYTNDYFHGRFGWRLDGKSDVYNMESEGMEMMYRLEERVLKNYVDGLSVWANGWWKGIGTKDLDIKLDQNWLYAQWNRSEFSSQLRLGYLVGANYQEFDTRLQFYYNVFPWLSAGAAGTIRIDGGVNKVRDVPYKNWFIEPLVKATLNPNTYIAFVYHYEYEPISLTPEKIMQTNWFNLRVVYTF